MGIPGVKFDHVLSSFGHTSRETHTHRLTENKQYAMSVVVNNHKGPLSQSC